MSEAKKKCEAYVKEYWSTLKWESGRDTAREAYLAGYEQAIDDAADAVDEWEEGSDEYTAGLLSSKISKLKDDEA